MDTSMLAVHRPASSNEAVSALVACAIDSSDNVLLRRPVFHWTVSSLDQDHADQVLRLELSPLLTLMDAPFGLS